jgi:porin
MNKRIATSDLTGRLLSSTRRMARHGRSLSAKLAKGIGLASVLAVSLMGLPGIASAACDLPELGEDTNGGIPEDAAFAFDPGGVRNSLGNAGIAVGGAYYAEAFNNWGGIKDGGQYNGVLELYANADMQRLGFWSGLCFHANGYQIHGKSITGENVGGLMPVSSLEAEPATRLFEIWFEQFLFNDTVSVKIGQLAADEEFFAADGGRYFLNGTRGWAPIASENNPSGGPAYPLATPGVRVAVAPTERTSVLVGLYNGDPAPQCNKAGGNPQRCNDHGVDFELDDDPLLMVEGAYSYELGGGRLPGTIKVGGWNHFGDFEHQRVDVGGELIAISGNGGKPLEHDWAIYGTIEQLIWRKPGSKDPQGVGVFAQFAGAPEDRNLVDIYFDVGITFTGMIPRRPNDALAVGFAYTGISDEVSAFDVDSGEPAARNYESLVEITYTFEISQGWVVQPDFLYMWNPGGGGVDHATVVGARNTLSF